MAFLINVYQVTVRGAVSNGYIVCFHDHAVDNLTELGANEVKQHVCYSVFAINRIFIICNWID